MTHSENICVYVYICVYGVRGKMYSFMWVMKRVWKHLGDFLNSADPYLSIFRNIYPSPSFSMSPLLMKQPRVFCRTAAWSILHSHQKAEGQRISWEGLNSHEQWLLAARNTNRSRRMTPRMTDGTLWSWLSWLLGLILVIFYLCECAYIRPQIFYLKKAWCKQINQMHRYIDMYLI